MEKLMKPVEYAQELGISRQAVYAKIKRGILTSKEVEGKLYIVVDSKDKVATADKEKPSISKKPKASPSANSSNSVNYETLLLAKDETISVLKGTVKDLKKSNKQISSTLKGEIDLLKEAFHEMRSMYMLQIEQKKTQTIEEPSKEDISVIEIEEEHWIGIKKFFKKHNVDKTKHAKRVMKRLLKAYKKGDERLMEVDNKLKMNAKSNYKDIVK